MLAVMSAAFGFALNAHVNIVTNYFDEILGLKGPQFGYITAIREVPGFLLIFLTAVLYRISLQRVTAGALVLMAVGYAFYGLSDSFWSVVPWTVLSSLGFHTVLQTQYSLGMSLTTESRSGAVLGRMNAVFQAGTLVSLAMVFVLFQFRLLSFRPTFVILGAVAFVGALAVVGFPHLHEGQLRQLAPKRAPLVWRRDYRYYYLLNILDGARQQIFFSFGLWVLVNRFHLGVAQISALLIAVTFVSMTSSTWVGRMIDRHGERRALSLINLAYVVALGGYVLADSVVVAGLCYLLYSFIMPVSPIAASTYLRKVAVAEEVAPSLAMGVTLMHATAIVVPVVAGVILNFVGYQIPFLIAGGFALVTFAVTRRLDPESQRSPRRIAAESARLAATNAAAEATAVLLATDGGLVEEIAPGPPAAG
ncbi:MAG: MFS transporter [Thermoleophilia bacterium]|nr:MFS transporter [Thermoleophilia bacterium]